MFLRRHTLNNPYNIIAENIKKDLMEILRQKGLSAANVKINMRPGNLNLQVFINKK